MTINQKHNQFFESILFTNKKSRPSEYVTQPDCFPDLNLDQVVDSMTSKKAEFGLKPFFYNPLHQKNAIQFRQKVFKDLENRVLYKSICDFAEKMILVRRHLEAVKKLYYPYHQKGWFLEAALEYREAVETLLKDISSIRLQSQGLSAFRGFVSEYANSEDFLAFSADVTDVKE